MLRRGRGTRPSAISSAMVRAISTCSAGPAAQLAPGLVPAVECDTNSTDSSARSVPVISAKRFWASPAKVFASMCAHTTARPSRARAARVSAAW